MVFFLIGPALIVAAGVLFKWPGTNEADGKPKQRKWPLFWLLFCLGLFFLRVWAFLARLLMDITPLGRLLRIGRVLRVGRAVAREGSEPSSTHAVFLQSLVLLAIAIGGYYVLQQNLSRLPA